MRKRLHLKTRVSASTRQRLRNIAAVGTIGGLIAAIFFLYDFIADTRQARAEQQRLQSTPGLHQLDGYAVRTGLNFKEELFPQGAGPQTPLLVSLRLEALKQEPFGGRVVSKDGNDIAFTYADGRSPVNVHIERYEPETGKLLAWIYPDRELPAESLRFYLYYGSENAAKAKQEHKAVAMWPVIWHLNGNFKVHGVNPLAGEYKGVKDEEGLFAGAKDFLPIEEGAAVFEAMPEATPEGSFTISCWIKPRLSGEKSVLFSNQSTTGGCVLYLNEAGKICFSTISKHGRIEGINDSKGGSTLNDNQWSQITATYDAQSKLIRTYINGKPDRIAQARQGAGKGSWMILGANPDLKSGYFNGTVDELRIGKTAISEQTVATLFAIESSPDMAIKADGEEVFAGLPSMADISKFEAHANASHVAVNWTTREEKNLDLFTLERSTDGQAFYKVNSTFAKGTNNGERNYQMLDQAPMSGNTYYRLRFTNFRNESQISNVVHVHYDAPPTALNIQRVEPNPFSSDFTVHFNSKSDAPLELKLTSISGKVVHSEKMKPDTSSLNRYSFADKAPILPGIYFLSLTQLDEQKTVKLVKRM